MRTVVLPLVATLMLSATASAEETNRKHFKGNLDLPFSEAVLAGNTLYISGGGGFLPGTTQVPEDPAEEARLLLESFKVTLARVDMTMDHLVSVTVFCPDLSLYQTFNEVYRSYFEKDFPARAFIGSGPLLFGMRFEMKGIAVK